MRAAVRYFLFFSILCFFPVLVHASVVINEVQIAGSGATDEFVELYNNGSDPISVSGWRLTKKTASGNEYNLLTTFPSITIPAGSFFVIAHEHYSGPKQLTYSTSQSIAQDNSILLYRDAGETVIDVVGFGIASVREGTACQNPSDGQSLQRIPDGVDSDQNANDFAISIPTPGIMNAVANAFPSSTVANQNSTSSQVDSTKIQTPSPSIQHQSSSYSSAHAVISEILPNPVGIDTEGEWSVPHKIEGEQVCQHEYLHLSWSEQSFPQAFLVLLASVDNSSFVSYL